MNQIDNSIPFKAQGVDLPDVGGMIQNAVSIADMLKQRRRQDVLDARQDVAYNQQQQQQQAQQQQAQKDQQSAAMLEQQDAAARKFLSEKFDAKTNRFNTDAIPDFYNNFDPKIADKYTKVMSDNNKYMDEHDERGITSKSKIFDIAKKEIELQREKVDHFAGEMLAGLKNPIIWATAVAHARADGQQIPDGLEQLQDEAQKKAFVDEYHKMSMTASEQEKADIAAAESEHSQNIAKRKMALEEKRIKMDEQKASEALKAKPNPEQRKPMSDTGAKTLGLISSGIDGAQTFLDALNSGDINFWDTGLLGSFSNPAARIAFDKATESLGRLNSGGAITTDEEKRFNRLIADKKNLVTEGGRKAIASELQKFIQRGRSTGDLIYGGDAWQESFKLTKGAVGQAGANVIKSKSGNTYNLD